jgi:hypothetical protein
MNQLQIFIIRAVIGVAFAVIATRMYYGSVNPLYVVGLAVVLVGLAYFAEFIRNKRLKK